MAASNTDLFRKGTNNFSTTLSGSIGSGDTTITLASTTNLPTDTGIDLVIDRVDASGNKTPSAREYIIGVVSSSNIISVLRGKGGSSAQSHSSGAVVEYVYTQDNHNDRVSGITQDHTQLGYHKSLTDANGKTWLSQTATASAVNYLALANAATGGSPLLSAAGSDSNINLYLSGKGTGTARFYGIYDGWVTPNESWSYSSYDSTNKTGVITVPSGAANKYNVGDRVKFTNNSAIQYGIIQVVADTALTVYFGTQYSLTNSAITLNYYSHENNPVGFPTRADYWTATLINDNSDRSQSSATSGTWYNPGSLSGSLPIGAWEIMYKVPGRVTTGSASTSVYASQSISLSTANNSESNNNFTTFNHRNNTTEGELTHSLPPTFLAVASATTYYLVTKAGATGNVSLGFFGSTFHPTLVWAVNAYL